MADPNTDFIPPNEPPPPYPGSGPSHSELPPPYSYPVSDGAAQTMLPPPYRPASDEEFKAQCEAEDAEQAAYYEYVPTAHVSGPPPRQSTVIVTQPMRNQPLPVSLRVLPKPPNYMALSIVTCFCFSPLFGTIAICFSALSQSAYLSGNVEGARQNGVRALSASIVGIILSAIIIILVATTGFFSQS